ncbi:MAG: peptidylprolyl isomerase [Pseudomonadales bacterium]
MMKITRAFTITLIATLFAVPATAKVEVLDGIVAIVDESVILRSELNERVRSVKAQIESSNEGNVPPDEVLQDQILERLIVEHLQLQMAERAGVRIGDEELNAAMRRIAAQNNLSLDEFRQAIQADGIPYADMREQVRREMAISRVQQGVMNNRIKVAEKEIENFLQSETGEVVTADEYRLAHILLPIPNDVSSDRIQGVKEEAEDILRQINEGANFQMLATEKSTGQNALEGGDLGWRKAVQLPTIFSEIAPEMEEGEVRGPIKSGSGYHLIKLLAKRGAEAEGQIKQTKVRHVLVKPNEIRTEQEARELAESLRREVIDDRPFEEVAKLHSDDPGSALSGGDLGWSRTGQFVPEFEKVMKNSKEGEISPVFKTENGYHFLEVTGRRVEDFSRRYRMGQAEQYLRNQKFDEELESWIQEIREDAFVEKRI